MKNVFKEKYQDILSEKLLDEIFSFFESTRPIIITFRNEKDHLYIKHLHNNGMNVSDISKKINISRQAVYKKINQ